MKILVTGLNGTVAPRLAEHARAAGHTVQRWDRSAVPADGSAAGDAWLAAERPDAIAHLALGTPPWGAQLAAHAARAAIPFVYTSTAMVFDAVPDGPHQPGDARTAKDDYGRSKIAGEDAVLAANPAATIARLGWQIDPVQPGNNMLRMLDDWQRRDGRIAASRAWTVSCAFLDDTAAALLALLLQPRPGVAHLDSNAVDAQPFSAVVQALARQYGRGWNVQVDEGYRHDQRLVGGPVQLPPLSRRLHF